MAPYPDNPRRPFKHLTSLSPSSSFTVFPQLPAEIRLEIWNFSMAPDMSTCIVPVIWSPQSRVLYSPRRPPVLLHVNRESRQEALKIYQLRFGSSPEFTRVYFSYENDILLFNWASLGPAPEKLGRKIRDEECKHVRAMMINEEALLLHAEENLRELERFSGLRDLVVLCDSENPQSGEEFGADEMEAFAAEKLDEFQSEDGDEGSATVARKEEWPEVVCLRDHEGPERCSRHWWFDGWNQRARVYQKEKWTTAMAHCLRITKDDPRDAYPDDLFLHFLALFQENGDSTI